jgi:hypothetical protein
MFHDWAVGDGGCMYDGLDWRLGLELEGDLDDLELIWSKICGVRGCVDCLIDWSQPKPFRIRARTLDSICVPGAENN